MATLVLAGVLTQSPDELLRRSDFGAFAPPSFRARLALRSLAQHSTHEIEVWRATLDPIINARAWLTSDGVATEAEIDGIDREVDEETEAAIAWAETGPIASPITPEEIYGSY